MSNSNKNLKYLRLNCQSMLFLLALWFATVGFFIPSQANPVLQNVARIAMTIQGHVTNETGVPIEGAILSVKWSDQETTSDLNGMFKLFNVNEGDTITAKHNLYQTLEFRIEKAKVNYFISLKNGTNIFSERIGTGATTPLRNVSGIVSNENGQFLPYAIVIVKGTRQGTFADSTGKFEIPGVPIVSKLSISHVGFIPEEIGLQKDVNDYKIVLKKATNQLDEIVVVGYALTMQQGNKAADQSANTNTSGTDWVMTEQNPEFPGGKQAMFRYLGQNIHYPTEAANAGIQGKVFVSFTINENGNIRNPRIVKGLGFGIDEEVLRVVLNMPGWMPAMQMKQAVAIEYNLPIIFDLELGPPARPAEKK